jgi:hypothetical protein
MAILDQGVNLAGERMFAGLGRQVRGSRSEGLNAGLLV